MNEQDNTLATCSECGARFDVEDGDYGVSLNGEAYCCSSCMDECVTVSSFKGSMTGWMADASLENVEVCIRRQPDQQTALKEAFSLAEINWEGIPAYIEVI